MELVLKMTTMWSSLSNLFFSSSQRYQLRNQVIYSGNAGGGHYTALVRTDEHFWNKYDDAALPLEVPWAVVLQAEAYLLIYEAVPTETR